MSTTLRWIHCRYFEHFSRDEWNDLMLEQMIRLDPSVQPNMGTGVSSPRYKIAHNWPTQMMYEGLLQIF